MIRRYLFSILFLIFSFHSWAAWPALENAEEEAFVKKTERPAEKNWRVDLGAGAEQYSYYTSSSNAFFQLLYKRSQRFYLLGRLDYTNAFGDQSMQYTTGGGYYVTPSIVLNNTVAFSKTEFITPLFQNAFEINGILPRELVLSLGYVYTHYQDLNVHSIRPNLSWYFISWGIWDINYYLTFNDFDQRTLKSPDHGISTRVTITPLEDKFSFHVFYARSQDSYDPGSIFQLGKFLSHTVGGGWEWTIAHGVGLQFSLDYEHRSNGQRLHRYNSSLFYKF